MENKISSIKTIPVRGANGPASAIMIGIDILDTTTLSTFISEVGSNFTSQMLMSPENTNMMLITVIGNCTAAEFKIYWDGLQKTDPVIEYYMSTMQVADCIHGTPDGKVLDQVSLLKNDLSPRPGM
jgi:hypothetical protein